jgi:hypothetical protein
MYTTLTLIQLACSFGDATTWHPNQVHLPISTLYTSLLVFGGKKVPCNLTQVVFDTLGGTLAFVETIITFYKYAQLDSGEPNTPGSSNTFSNSIHVFLTTLSLWGTNSLRRRETKSQTID